MAFPPHFKLTWGGPLGTEDTWSCGLRFSSGVGLDVLAPFDRDVYEEFAEGRFPEVRVKVEEYMLAIQAQIPSSAALGWVKFNAIDTEGLQVADTTNDAIYDPVVARGQLAPGPYSNALVISLESGRQRGLAVIGRYFLPIGNVGHGQDGKIERTRCEAHATAAVAFINRLNDWAGPDLGLNPQVSIVSRGRKLPNGSYGEGAAKQVVGVGVGNVVDTQRRRRAQVKEQYVRLPLTS